MSIASTRERPFSRTNLVKTVAGGYIPIVLATVIVSVLLMLSGILIATTLFPSLDTTAVASWLAVALGVGLLGTGGRLAFVRVRHGPAPSAAPEIPHAERASWHMPPLALLEPVTWSSGVKLGMSLLRGYLVVAALLLLVKAIQIG